MTLQDFIRMDIKNGIMQKKAIAGKEMNSDNILEELNQIFLDVEQKVISMEGAYQLELPGDIGSNPVKVFIKRCVRKLTMWLFNSIISQQTWYNTLNNAQIYHLKDSIRLLINTVNLQKDVIERQVKLLNQEINNIKTFFDTQKYDIQEIIETKSLLDDFNKKFVALEYNHDTHNLIDYKRFEEKFRGDPEEIYSRLSRYICQFKVGQMVADLGCGRGELLTLMVENGIQAVGVDTEPEFIELCKSKGLNVVEMDLFQYLLALDDDEMDGFCAIQVIEHLSSRALVDLIQNCYTKLKKGGIIILETLNPKVLSIYASYFYADLTHKRPIHPETLKFLLVENGFRLIDEDYPEYAKAREKYIPKLEDANDDAAFFSFNKQMEYLNELLYGSLDYAIIAEKA